MAMIANDVEQWGPPQADGGEVCIDRREFELLFPVRALICRRGWRRAGTGGTTPQRPNGAPAIPRSRSGAGAGDGVPHPGSRKLAIVAANSPSRHEPAPAHLCGGCRGRGNG